MYISALNSAQSFKSNAPIYHAYLKRKDGTQEELPSREIKGPALALVRRLNDPYSREAEFLRQHISDFRDYELATSSIMGRNDIKKKHIIFGEDAYITNNLREDCYRRSNMTRDEVSDLIHRTIIDPIDKKVRMKRDKNDLFGEQVGLVLFTEEGKKTNKLNGLQIISLDGRVFAELPPYITGNAKRAAANKAKAAEEQKAIQEEKQKTQVAEKPAKTQPEKTEEYQPDLLGFEYPEQPKRSHWDYENDPPRKTRSRIKK